MPQQVAIENVRTAAADSTQASDKRKINEYILEAFRMFVCFKPQLVSGFKHGFYFP